MDDSKEETLDAVIGEEKIIAFNADELTIFVEAVAYAAALGYTEGREQGFEEGFDSALEAVEEAEEIANERDS